MYVIFDLESDGLNIEDVSKIHCLSMNWRGGIKSTASYSHMRDLLQRGDITLVGHNVITYDVPVLEKILGVKVKCKVICTLALSWYLYPKRFLHGLEQWGEEFGVSKPEVDDWVGLTYEEYKFRCEEDVRINTLLWEKMQVDLAQLYDSKEQADKLMDYLSFKMKVMRVQQNNPLTFNRELCLTHLETLEEVKEQKTEQLKLAMPVVGVKSMRTPPAKPYKQDNTLSATGIKWKKLTEEQGLPFEHDEPIEVIKNYDEPNPNSIQQLKDWLLSLGWKPTTFSQGVNGKVPQIYTQDKSICESVSKLDSPAIEYLEGLGVLKHRIGLLKGFLRDAKGDKITQDIAGFTSTLRLRHKFLVNLPKPSLPYGEMVRGVLTCDEGYELCGSDLASLEDRTKIHYIYPFDTAYANTMMEEDYDPHLTFCEYAGVLNAEQVQAHKEKREDHSVIRHKYKQVNYMATYSVGAKKLSEYLGIKVREAKKMIDDYWGLNWSVKAFAETCETKEALGVKWIKNPTNGFYYELRSEKDKFSAVNQSTGSYIFDLWLGFIIQKGLQPSGQFHDEGVWVVKKGSKEQTEKTLTDSINKVNRLLKLNRDMDIDVQWGSAYSDVH